MPKAYNIINRYENSMLTAKTEILNYQTSNQVRFFKTVLKEAFDGLAEYFFQARILMLHFLLPIMYLTG